ncbi:hypothetical protein TD95_000722 [Thielaviopsis punctulata]|uniref:Short chain dehydrogenase/reductase n=1 Tax=Thielaviopsis punctulata TaxID=72032 RepID=A0A0F4ZJS4_9PEZI|nr:hypothetical protein TD95_000722 [Thielaviopsis punctulata]
MPAPVFCAGSTALITGAGSGIGLALATFCASQGMSLLLVDKDTARLSSLSTEFPSSKIRVESCDVSSASAWAGLRETVVREFGSVELLALNAGTMKAGASWDDVDAFRVTIETNLFGVIYGIQAMLPEINKAAEQQKKTAIVITGSKQGITNPPGNPAYNASKAAVKSVAEQLSFDLQKQTTTVHLLVPGWTFTGMTGSKATAEKPAGAWTPEQVVQYLDEKMSSNEFYIICPDNEVDEETDKKRMLWAAGDVVYRRPALSRWREETKAEAAEGVSNMMI